MYKLNDTFGPALSNVSDAVEVKMNADVIREAFDKARAAQNGTMIELTSRLMMVTVGGRNRGIDMKRDLARVREYLHGPAINAA